MKNKKKGIWAVFGIVMIVNLAVVGFNLLELEPQEDELQVWATWGDDPKPLQGLFDRFTQETGVPVRVKTGVKPDRLEKALAGSQPPDVVILSGNAPVGAYEQQGWIEPLESWIETAGIDLEDIFPAPLTQCASPQGGYACLPWGADTFALYWNKELFAAAGLDPELPPQTLEEIFEISGALTVRYWDGALSQVGFLPDTPRSHLDLYAQMFGVTRISPAGGFTAALEWERGFYAQLGMDDAYAFAASINRYLNSSHPVFGGARLNCQQCHRYAPPKNEGLPDQGFFDGKVAMMVDGTWQLFSRMNEASQPGFEFGAVPIPPAAQQPQGVDSAYVQGPVVIIPAGAANKEAAAGLLGWMMSPETVAEMAYAASLLPSSIRAAQDPRFQQIQGFADFMALLGSDYAGAAVSTPERMELNAALAALEKEVLHEWSDPATLLDAVQAEFGDEF